MSKYTTELRYICEKAYGLEESAGGESVNTIINSSRVQYAIFPSFPIFDENYRQILQAKILRHYYTQEIGEETVALWKLRLDTRLNEIMPYYNKLYESELLKFNPLYNVDYTRTGNRDGATTNDGTENRAAGGSDTRTEEETRNDVGTSETTREAGTWDLYSDTPQGGIDGVEAAGGALAGNGYLTNARHTYGDGKSDLTETTGVSRTDREDVTRYGRTDNAVSHNSGTSTEDYLEHIVGYQGRSPVESLIQFRESFINIDLMIIENLQDLFMGVW